MDFGWLYRKKKKLIWWVIRQFPVTPKGWRNFTSIHCFHPYSRKHRCPIHIILCFAKGGFFECFSGKNADTKTHRTYIEVKGGNWPRSLRQFLISSRINSCRTCLFKTTPTSHLSLHLVLFCDRRCRPSKKHSLPITLSSSPLMFLNRTFFSRPLSIESVVYTLEQK